jgi:hypothetical protein
MIVGIDPKVDYAFKRVYGLERNRAILRHSRTPTVGGTP